MATECHDAKCTYHGVHHGEEGPFCFETTCRNTPAHKLLREFELICAEFAKKPERNEVYVSAKAFIDPPPREPS